MQREFLKGLELSDEAIDKIMAENGKDVNDLKAQLHTVESERDGYKSQVDDRDTQLSQLKKDNEGNADLQAQITDLQAQIQSKDDEAANQLTATKTDYEIQLALQQAGALNYKTVLPLLDREQITLKDGKIDGITEQLEAIQKDNAYLFQATETEEPQPTGKITISGNPNPATGGESDPFAAVVNSYK